MTSLTAPATSMDTSRMPLTVYGGLLVSDDEVDAFRAAEGSPALGRPAEPTLYLYRWLKLQRLNVKLVVCCLKRSEILEDNPLLNLLLLGEKRVTFADVDFTDTGVVPKELPRAPDEVRERVRGWLGLHASEDDCDVSDLADRFAWLRSKTPDERIRRVFEAVATFTGNARKDCTFALVYNRSDAACEARVRQLLQDDPEAEDAQM